MSDVGCQFSYCKLMLSSTFLMIIRVCIIRISNTRNAFDILKAVLTFICLQKCQTSPNIKTCELTISAEC